MNKTEDIMKAALVLFAERGYGGTTVPMIAFNAQVGTGTIYRYFESKESLVNKVFQHCVTEFSETLKYEAINSTSNIQEQFHSIFQNLIKFAEQNNHALLFINSHNNAYYLDRKSKEVFDEMLSPVHQMLGNGKKIKIIKDFSNDVLIAMVYGAFIMLFKLINSGVVKATYTLLQDVEKSCWDAIRSL